MTVFEARPRLLQAFRMGERPALRTVYLHYVDDVFALARHGFLLSGTPPRRIPGESDGERVRDTVQQVFVRAFARRARMAFDGVRRYRPYLLTIAKNLCVDLARRAGRELPASEPAHRTIAEMVSLPPINTLRPRCHTTWLMMLAVPVKMAAKLLFDIKYGWVTPWFNV